MEDNRNYSGMLLDWSVRAVDKDDLLGCPSLHFMGMAGKSKWERYEFRSDQPLLGEELVGSNTDFSYPVLCRRSGRRLLILSAGQKVVEHIVEEEFANLFVPHLRKVKIAVDQLVRGLTNKPTLYVLGYVHAKLPVFGALLRSASFYGDDLAEASLFKENIGLMNFSTCGLRPAVGPNEIVRLNSDGSLYHVQPDPDRLVEVEHVFRFLRESGYL
jgi:hypothetical protein